MQIGETIAQGNKEALVELASYLDSPRVITDYLGYHRLQVKIQNIARRIISENSLFFEEELQIDSSLTRARFLQFLDSNRSRLFFDDTTGEFLLTPLSARHTAYELRSLNEEEMKGLPNASPKTEYPDWVYIDGIIKPLIEKDPIALLWIAAGLYQTRSRFNDYYFNQQEYIDLLARLTHEELGVPDETGATTFLYPEDYQAVAKLNYLIYWERHYLDYRWDPQENIFVNTKDRARDQSPVESLFKNLQSKVDSVAQNAFLKAATRDTAEINAELGNYVRSDIDLNNSLPIFPYKFMDVISRMVSFCRSHGVEYEPRGLLAMQLNRLLQANLPFRFRYANEDSLINQLTLDQVTAVEYFGLLHEENWDCTYSIGRILDKFYSRNWLTLIRNKSFLALYVKKAAIFEDLGIIGICGKYRKKFENCSPEALKALEWLKLDTADKEIEFQARKLLDQYSSHVTVVYDDKKVFDGNSDTHTTHIKHRLYKAVRSAKTDDDAYSAVSKIVGMIRFDQIGQLLKIADEDSVMRKQIYNFLDKDFGFPIEDDDRQAWKKFADDYARLNEYQLYEKYLGLLNPNYALLVGKSDYQGIYDVLNFDVVDAFVGGGGSRREDGVYMLIKLLELKFHTSLGFPHKVCNASGIYGCDCTDRAKYWLRFLEQRNLARANEEGPVSVSHNY